MASSAKRISMKENLLYAQDFLSIKDLQLAQVEQILSLAAELKANPVCDLLKNKIIAHCFFEPSTRTRLSFETATLRLGGNVIGFDTDSNISAKKGESLHDTIRVIDEYADLIVIRHKKEGAARLAAEVANKPVINAGDGANQHPTQALVDLFTIRECQGKMNGLSIALVGDLKHARTIHSFTEACMFYDVRLFLVAPEELSLPEAISDKLKKNGVRFSFHQSLEEVIPKVDILYLTRLQKERMSESEQSKFSNRFILQTNMLTQAKPTLKILHPLPRVDEMDIAIDRTPFAYYFAQAANGIFLRQALLTLLLNRELP